MVNRFVLATSTRPLPEFTAPVDDPAATALPPVTRHVSWTDAGTHVRYWGWEHGATTTVADERGLRAWAGTPRPRRAALVGSTEARLRDLERVLTGNHDDVCDAYAFVSIDADGRGFVTVDPMGVHPLFIAEGPGATVVGNRAGLVSAVASRLEGRPPRRDPQAAAWLAFCGFVMDDTTGHQGVRRVAQDRTLRLRRGEVHEESHAPLWSRSADEDPVDDETVADEVEADIAAALRHTIAASADRGRLELTGGKDSRAILAVAAREGLLADLELVTYGAAHLLDVQVARELAEAVGADHVDITEEHRRAAARLTPVERLRRHVRRTAGMSFLGDANEPSADPRPTTSGLLGEILRIANHRERTDPVASTEAAVRRFVGQRPLGDLDLLRPEPKAACLARATALFSEAAGDVRSPSDLRTAHFIRRRVPGWQGPIADLHAARVLPYYSPAAIRLALRLSPRRRALESTHAELVRRAGRTLLEIPFANDRWHGSGPSIAPREGTVGVKAPRPDDGTGALLTRLIDERPDNPAFDLVDRDALRAAVAGVSNASATDRRQILGAMAGVVWLGELDDAVTG